jgi:hypothetical protein
LWQFLCVKNICHKNCGKFICLFILPHLPFSTDFQRLSASQVGLCKDWKLTTWLPATEPACRQAGLHL